MVSKENLLKQWLIPLLKLGVAAGLIYWLISSGRFDLAALGQMTDPSLWVIGAFLFLGVVLVNAKRWQLLLRFEEVHMSYIQSVRLSLIGIFFNYFMPGGVGGDVVKASYLMRSHAQKKWFIGWSIFVDRVLGMLALLLYSGVTGLFFYSHLESSLQASFYSLSLLIVLGFITLLFLLVLIPKNRVEALLKAHSLVEKVLHPLFYFFKKPKRIILPFILSLLSQGLVISLGAVLILRLGASIPLWALLLVFPFGFLATILPISPGGVGVGQAAFSFLFASVAGNGAFGVLVITYFQAVQFLVGLLGGLIFVLYKKKEG